MADELAQRSIVLVGFMAAGKSRIGRLLAERLALPFVDTDAEIEGAFGMSIAEVFQTHGEPAFREAEKRLIAEIVAGDAKIVAVGGGAFLDANTRQLLIERTRTVWLNPPFELILSRLSRSKARPLAAGKSTDELRNLWDERRASYAEAQVHVAVPDTDPDSVADLVLERLT